MNRGPKRLVCSASAQYEWTGKGSGPAIRFLATDLDGTLLTSEKRITAHTKRIIIDAQNRGLTVILASGRPLYSILPFAKDLELDKHHGFIIAYNGGLIYDCASGETICDYTIPACMIPALRAAVPCETFRLHGYKGNSIVVQGEPDEWSNYIARANKMPLLKADDFVEAIVEPQHKCLVTGAPRRLWHLEKKINRLFESSLSAYRSESFLLEVVPKGIDKAESLRKLLTMLNGKTEELLCCGDGYNDINMMQLGGLSCATRNAKRPVKQIADFITESNDCDGVAAAIRCLL